MESNEPTPGTIVTFYSFKGGTGRSMALANLACLIGRSDVGGLPQVLVMDWDIEAPGLHRYLAPYVQGAEDDERPGLLDYFHRLRTLLRGDGPLYERMQEPGGWRALEEVLQLDDYIIRSKELGIDFIKAGRFDADYDRLVTTFDWAKFYVSYPEVIRVFREMLAARYEYSLIDSRTGLTDISGICTMLLPERLVLVFTPNWQSLDGVLQVARKAVKFRRESEDFRPLTVFPVPSRVELSEQKLKEDWRRRYQSAFETFFREAYHVESCDLTAHFGAVQIPHVSYYSYGERIAVLRERTPATNGLLFGPLDRLSLSGFYQTMYERFVNSEMPCAESEYEKHITITDGGRGTETTVVRGPLVWQKVLSATDAQRQSGNPTGDIRLTQAGWRDEQGRPIDQTVYFRHQVFGQFDWRWKDGKVEEVTVPFDVTIFGIGLGVYNLVVSHKPSGEAGQRNYTTGIQWGELTPRTRQANLAGKLLRLYAPPAGRRDPFFIEIVESP